MDNKFVRGLSKLELPAEQLALLALLDELAATPWKFDLLWSAWPALGSELERRQELGNRLLRADSAELLLRGTVVFDDITIFGDVIGGPDDIDETQRGSCRAAYLSLRPTVVRGTTADLPTPPGAATQDMYLTRIAYVAAELKPNAVADVNEVLAKAAERYERRGKTEGTQICRQNIEILALMAQKGLLGPPESRGEGLPLELPIGDWYTLLEVATQWWSVFTGHIRGAITKMLNLNEDAEDEVDWLVNILSIVAQKTRDDPGPGSSLAALGVLRLFTGTPPGALTLIPEAWLQQAEAAVTSLHRSHREHLPNLQPLYALLVDIERDARRPTTTKSTSPRTHLDDRAELGLLMADVLFKARLRARNELSRDSYAQLLLDSFRAQVALSPTIIEHLVVMGAQVWSAEEGFGRALLEAAEVLAPAANSPEILRFVADALQSVSRRAERNISDAKLMEARGRVDLALMAWHNAALALIDEGSMAAAVDALTHAWALLSQVDADEFIIPESIEFSLVSSSLSVVDHLARLLIRASEHRKALKLIQQALCRACASSNSRPLATDTKPDAELIVELMLAASQCHVSHAEPGEATSYLTEARTIADANQLSLEGVRVRVHQYLLATNVGGQNAMTFLDEGMVLAEQARRSYPFERDKIRVLERCQEPYVWLGERNIELQNSWEALASFEGLRSRALLDLLGLSPALQMPAALDPDVAARGAGVLQQARAAVFPGEGSADEWASLGLRSGWARNLGLVDDWLASVAEHHPAYASVVAGRSMGAADLETWAEHVSRPTVVVFWFLGERFSYQAALFAEPNRRPQPPAIQRVPLTLKWLDDSSRVLRDSVSRREDPPAAVIDDLSRQLLLPIHDYLDSADVIYLCPSQALHALPLSALDHEGAPLNTQKQVAIIPTLSVLRVLQLIDSTKPQSWDPVVFGPQFGPTASAVARLLGTEPLEQRPDRPGAVVDRLRGASLIHFICHGHFVPDDPWTSGFTFGSATPYGSLTGYEIVRWRLNARLVSLQACDTRRQDVTTTDDTFGLGRFLQIAGAPSLLLSDWNVREDVSTVFMAAFYARLRAGTDRHAAKLGRGEAYRAGMRAVYDAVGRQHRFLWAPFTLVGVAD